MQLISLFKLFLQILYKGTNLKGKKLQVNKLKFKLFDDYPLSDATKEGLKKNNFIIPTEIQRETLYYALTGADVVGAAKTGSGKTLAFIIPVSFFNILERIDAMYKYF